jgi:hypothetical protein
MYIRSIAILSETVKEYFQANAGNNQRRVAAKTPELVRVNLMLNNGKTLLYLGVCVYSLCWAILCFSKLSRMKTRPPLAFFIGQ